MNILYIANDSRIGGANLSLLGIADEISDIHNIYVVVPIKKGLFVDELEKRNIPYIYLHSFWWMIEPAASEGATIIKKLLYRALCYHNYICAWRLRKVVRKNRIDIIHTNSSVINTGGILAKMTGIPHVWHIRELEEFGFISVWNDEKRCRFIGDNSDKVVAISKAVYEKYIPYIDQNKLTVIYNGVSENNLIEKRHIKENGTKVHFLISGRINVGKGQAEAIEAVAKLVYRGYTNLHLSIAGDGDDTALKKLVAERKIEEYISFLGMVSDMAAVRRQTDVELVCSKCEAFGRVTIEAMMASNPVIGSNTGGTLELVHDGENGYLYQQGDANDLAQKMVLLLQNPESIATLGAAAYSFAKEFTVRKNAEDIVRLYDSIRDHKMKNLD